MLRIHTHSGLWAPPADCHPRRHPSRDTPAGAQPQPHPLPEPWGPGLAAQPGGVGPQPQRDHTRGAWGVRQPAPSAHPASPWQPTEAYPTRRVHAPGQPHAAGPQREQAGHPAGFQLPGPAQPPAAGGGRQ
ncbi:hypothetical protein LEMLEM_LOCUS25737 [Lemmus lemmus]